MRAIIVAIHGIDSTNQGWVDEFGKYIAAREPDITFIPSQYYTGPFPIINNLMLDNNVAAALAEKICFYSATVPVYLIGHSNGTVIAWRIQQIMQKKRKHVSGMILVAGAIDPNLDKNGIMAAVSRKQLGFAAAYCSHDDDVVRGDPDADKEWYKKAWDVVWGALMWPYGSLGTLGWFYAGKPLHGNGNGQGIFTRWFSGGHSGYWMADQIQATFSQIMDDIRNFGD